MYRDDYVENDVLNDNPVELVRLLYAKAIEKLHQAARHREQGDAPASTRAVGHAMEIVGELQGSLNHEQGGLIAETLGALYGYVQHRLTEAITQQAQQPLQEATALLGTLYEGWKQCQPPAAGRELPSTPLAEVPATDSAHVWRL